MVFGAADAIGGLVEACREIGNNGGLPSILPGIREWPRQSAAEGEQVSLNHCLNRLPVITLKEEAHVLASTLAATSLSPLMQTTRLDPTL